MKKIFAVDDDAAILRYLERLLSSKGYEVRSTTNPLDVCAMLAEEKPDLMILDLLMPVLDGVALFSELKKLDRELPVLFITAFHGSFNLGSDNILTVWHEYFGDGNVDILYKPFKEEALFQKIDMLIGKPDARP